MAGASSGIMKLSGSFIVVAAAALFGYTLANGLDQQIAEMNRFESLLISLRAEISYALLSLPKALKKCGEKIGGEAGGVFYRIGADMGKESRMPPNEALSKALGDPKCKVLPYQASLLKDLFGNLGTTGHREQMVYIESVLENAKSVRLSLENDCRNKAKICRYFGVLGGLCLVIVLF